MNRAIDRKYIDKVLAALKYCGSGTFCEECPVEEGVCKCSSGEFITSHAAAIIEGLLEERKRGRWMLSAHCAEDAHRCFVFAACSECGEDKEIWSGNFVGVPDYIVKDTALQYAKRVKVSNYCPYCGAEMEEVNDAI